MDFVADRLANGRRLRSLTVVDIYTRECLAIKSEQRLKGEDALLVLRGVGMRTSMKLLGKVLLKGVAIVMVAHGLAQAGEMPARVETKSESAILMRGHALLPISLKCPKFTVDGVQVGGRELPFRKSGSLKSGDALELSFNPIAVGDSARLEVKLYVKWSAEESVVRKWAEYRLSGDQRTRLLTEVVLEDLDTKAAGIRVLPVQPVRSDEYQSYPVFMEGFFAGVEFPVASSRLENGRVIISHRPGVRMQPGVKYETRKAVYGITPAGGEKQGFKRYIELNRPEPKGMYHFIYNPFWSAPTLPSQEHIREIAQVLRQKLYEPYGVAFDSCGFTVFTTDQKSIWQVDKKRFPRGYSDLEELCRAMGSHLDIFLSPSSRYPPALDPYWAEEQGYETFAYGDSRVLCLGGTRYQSETKKVIVDTVTRYHASHVFLDGYLFTCPESHHGHEPGILSAEPIADGIIDICSALHAAAPEVWLAATCFTWNASPWWSFHVNSVIGTYGDDAPYGRVPSPVYRESYTSARDYYNLQGAYWLTTPIRATESFGIIHQSDYPLLNDAVTDILRGNMEQHTAVNPTYMTGLRWKQLAALMNWARKNVRILQETEPLLPVSWQNGKCPRVVNDATMPREPYGYAHWHDGGGLVGLRNPWIEPRTYSIRIPVDKTGAASFSAVSIYPEVRVYGTNLKPGDILDVRLAPYETVVLSFEKRAAPKGVPDVSQSICRQLRAKVLRSKVSLMKLEGNPDVLGPDFTRTVGNIGSAISVDLDAEVIADAPASELLILVEDKEVPVDPLCKLRINGKDSELLTGGSETGWAASGLSKPERWIFLTSALSKGENTINLKLLTRGGNPTVSAWVWAKKSGSEEGGKHPNSLPQPEVISLDSINLLKPVDKKTASQTTKTEARPIERIDGIFLDAMDESLISWAAHDFRRNTSIAHTPITIAGRLYLRGIGTAGASRISVSLDKKYRRFQSWVGLDSGLMVQYFDRSAVTFEVWVDGQKRWDSGVMKNLDPAEPAKWVDVDVAGGKVLELVVVPQDPHGHLAQNWADWAEARSLK
jgi:hypothetical protein